MLHAVGVWHCADEGGDAIEIIDALLAAGFDAISHSTHPLSHLPQDEVEGIAGHPIARDVPVTPHSSPTIASGDLERVVTLFVPILRCVTFDRDRPAQPRDRVSQGGDSARAAKS